MLRCENCHQTTKQNFDNVFGGNAMIRAIGQSPQTPYEAWAGGAVFDDDDNADGVSNGLAWLLGASAPGEDARGLLPSVTENSGNLVFSFSMLNATNRGDALLYVQHSSDLGVSDAWSNNQALVPDASGTVNGVSFTVSSAGNMNEVTATIPSSEAVNGNLFGRFRDRRTDFVAGSHNLSGKEEVRHPKTPGMLGSTREIRRLNDVETTISTRVSTRLRRKRLRGAATRTCEKLADRSKRSDPIGMNWLAHLYLSDPEPCTRIGNLLPDILRQSELLAVPPEFQRGIAQHQRIDAFTDAHPVFRRSVQRIHAPFRRYAPLLVDIFYDHFLASDWSRYSAENLNVFVSRFHVSLDEEGLLLPPKALQRLRQIRDGGWLLSYANLDGVAAALHRTSLRLKKHAPLDDAVSILRADYPGFHSDFAEFFPLLRQHVANLT